MPELVVPSLSAHLPIAPTLSFATAISFGLKLGGLSAGPTTAGGLPSMGGMSLISMFVDAPGRAGSKE